MILTKKQAWEKVAQAFERYATTGRQNVLTAYGLCAALSRLADAGSLTTDQWLDMSVEIDAHDGDRTEDERWASGYYWPTTRGGAEHRAIFAQLLAESAED